VLYANISLEGRGSSGAKIGANMKNWLKKLRSWGSQPKQTVAVTGSNAQQQPSCNASPKYQQRIYKPATVTTQSCGVVVASRDKAGNPELRELNASGEVVARGAVLDQRPGRPWQLSQLLRRFVAVAIPTSWRNRR